MKKSVKHFAKKSKERYYSLSKFEKMMFGLFAIFIFIFLIAILVSGILHAYPYTPAGGATITTTNIWEIVDGITRLIVPSDVNISGNLNVSKNLRVGGNLTTNGVVNFKDVMRLNPKNQSPNSSNSIMGDLFFYNSSSTNNSELCFFDGVKWKGLVTGGDCGSSSCGDGWISVPGDVLFGTNDFCVMKYEAKNVGGVATSQAGSLPWTTITHTIAVSECIDIGAHLCTDKEAETINRNIEEVNSNWNGDTIGGCMYGGHIDNNPANALAASTDDTPYYGTEDSSGDSFGCPFDITVGAGDGKEQRRTFTLSTGEVIWDWSGNIWEWLYGEGASGTIGSTGSVTWRSTAGWVEWSLADLNEERAVLGASNSGWNSNNGIGEYYGGASTNAFLRGGYWHDGVDAGAFALSLSDAPSFSYASIGFRCCK